MADSKQHSMHIIQGSDSGDWVTLAQPGVHSTRIGSGRLRGASWQWRWRWHNDWQPLRRARDIGGFWGSGGNWAQMSPQQQNFNNSAADWVTNKIEYDKFYTKHQEPELKGATWGGFEGGLSKEVSYSVAVLPATCNMPHSHSHPRNSSSN